MNVQRSAEMSFEDYLAWENAQAEKHEFVSGRPVLRRLRLMAGGTEAHAHIAANLIAAFTPRLRGGPCRVFGSDFKIKSPTGNARYPDVMVKCAPPTPRQLFTTEPRVLIEVLSPSNDALDQFRLLEDYKAFASAAHIAFIAQERAQALIWTREGEVWTRADLDGAEASLALPALGLAIPFSEICDGVTFDERA